MDVKTYIWDLGRRARAAARVVAKADTETKNRALRAMAAAVRRERAKLLAANVEDVAAARAAGDSRYVTISHPGRTDSAHRAQGYASQG